MATVLPKVDFSLYSILEPPTVLIGVFGFACDFDKLIMSKVIMVDNPELAFELSVMTTAPFLSSLMTV
jgi:hypothetical protein